MQKHISHAENAPTAHIFYYPTVDINSQHPHLLGFDSNLVPNFNILVFQPYHGKDSEYLEESGRFVCISASPLGNTPNIWEIHLDWSYFLQDTAGFTATTEYIDYSLDSERITQILGTIIRRSSEMAKIAISAQEISENSEKSLYFCALIEEINENPFVDIVGLYHEGSSSRGGNSSNFHRID